MGLYRFLNLEHKVGFHQGCKISAVYERINGPTADYNRWEIKSSNAPTTH